MITKLAQGHCDDLLTAVALSYRGPKYIAPAMEEQMYFSPPIQHNLTKLKNWGWIEIEPETGPLASSLEGKGRMAEPETILQILQYKPLKGKKVLVTLGPTYEPIDPVRFIGNHSSGKMGAAISEIALHYGAEVTVIAGPVSIPLPQAHHIIRITTAQELFDAIVPIAPDYDFIWMVAAVADYTPEHVSTQKIKKEKHPQLTLTLKPTPDILSYLSLHKPKGQMIIGFSLESELNLDQAREKRKRKQCDVLVLNSLQIEGSGFQTDTNHVFVLLPDDSVKELRLAPKQIIARQLWDLLLHYKNEAS
jgi:phosphopantothenoylcysteine decarboxylase/phosphopantothenate--cysteine ligase